MGIVITIVVIFLCIITLLFIPLTYDIHIYAGKPFRIDGLISWSGRALQYTWSYTWGQRLTSSWYLAWKKQENGADMTEKTAAQAEEAIQKTLEETEPATYESLKNSQNPLPKAATFHWKPFVLNTDFAASWFRWLGRLVYHSRIRTWNMSGTIGLSQPHETGLLAGALYATIPDAVENLRFNYIEEQYDSTIYGAGTIYPAIVLFYFAAFILSRPVRRLIAGWHAYKKGSTSWITR